MAFDDVGVGEVNDRGFKPAFEDEERVAQQVLVESVGVADEHDQRILQFASGPARLLPERCKRTGEAGDDDAVEPTHVNAKLKRLGRDDSAKSAGREAGLDCAPVFGHVPGPVRRYRELGRVFFDPSGDEFGQAARRDEADGLESGPGKVRHKVLGLGVDGEVGGFGDSPHAGAVPLRQRVPEHEPAPAARRAVIADVCELLADQIPGQFQRVGNRGGGEKELRVGPVVAADAAEPADELGDVGAEHAAILVRLVNDAVTQVAVERSPLEVIGENLVQFVGIGEDDARETADARSLVRRRVAVVDRRMQLKFKSLLKLLEHLELVLGHGLHRVEVERGGGP